MNEDQHTIYQSLIGALQWFVTLGRFDIAVAVKCLLWSQGSYCSYISWLSHKIEATCHSRGELLLSEVATMSKHSLRKHERLSSGYMTELNPPILQVSSGLETAAVRSRSWWSKYLCLEFLVWNTVSLTEVVIQDGMYWVHEFPNHEATCQLLNILLPDYAEYAHLGRQCVRQQEQLVEQLVISA